MLDTNVLVSGIYFAGTPGRVLMAWMDGRFELLASVEIAGEYRRVIGRLERLHPAVAAAPVLDRILRECRLVEPVRLPSSVCDDPNDIMFLACAIAGRADCVVSGDRALLRASGCGGVPVLRPAEFAREIVETKA